MEQTTKEKKAEALKQLAAGKLKVEDLKRLEEEKEIRCYSAKNFEQWLRESYPDEAEKVWENFIESGKNEADLEARTSHLLDLFRGQCPGSVTIIKNHNSTMEQSLKDKKAEALKKLQAGKMSVEELKAETQGNGIDLEEFQKWVQQTYPSRAAVVFADLQQSEGDVERMEMQTLELASLFYASLHPEDDEKERNWLPWMKLHYDSTDFGDSASVPPGTYPSVL